jgi:hypothetical protein
VTLCLLHASCPHTGPHLPLRLRQSVAKADIASRYPFPRVVLFLIPRVTRSGALLYGIVRLSGWSLPCPRTGCRVLVLRSWGDGVKLGVEHRLIEHGGHAEEESAK